jgi:hypothetical protein
MREVIDVGSELLVDASTIRNPGVRLLTVVLGQKLATGSPWIAVNKREAALCRILAGPAHEGRAHRFVGRRDRRP